MKAKFFMPLVKFNLLLLVTLFMISCNNQESNPDFKISLAQWSLHRAFKTSSIDPIDFPEIAANYGIYSIELVNSFYKTKANDKAYWKVFKQKCNDANVNVGLIMCDRLGNLGDSDTEERMKAVENHYVWVDIAKYLGAHSIRVNAAGKGNAEEVAKHAIDGLSKLGTYAATKGINVIVENHGGYSSNGSWLSSVMKRIDMDNVGTLPDFGNFCLNRKADKTCLDEYDRYKGLTELMPYAKGVSAKAYGFDEAGNETKIDYLRMMNIVKKSGFKGYIGIEYEGQAFTEDEGIKATKALLEKVFKEL